MDTIYKSYKFRIYPNKEQQILIQKTIGSNRFVYNTLLSIKKDMYKYEGVSLSKLEAIKQLPSLKDTYTFLKEVDSTSLQTSIENLFKAYDNFFKNITKFPKFKSKKIQLNHTQQKK